MPEIERRRQNVLRLQVDDIHHIDQSLRRLLVDIESLRLAVVFDQEALTPFVKAKELECGELDFDELVFIFVKEQYKYIFFNLYIAQSAQEEPEILATGKIGVSEVAAADGSVWTIPMTSSSREICELTFCINQLPYLDQDQEPEYYPPDFTSAMDEIALGIRKVTAPASSFCQTVAVELLKTPITATSILKHLFCKFMQKLLS